MNQINIKRYMRLLLFVMPVFFYSCSDDDEPQRIVVGEEGFFILNEGAFGNGNASLSYYDRATDVVSNNLFAVQNGRPLGDQAQSMAIFDDRGFIVVQNSAKVEVINIDNFTSIATIDEGLPSPRYFIGISPTKGYVSDWGAGGVAGSLKIVDLTTYTVTGTISVGQGANRMLKVNNLVYVTLNGGYGLDNRVVVVDSNTDAVVNQITVGDNPNSIQRDRNGNLWVASSGKIVYNPDYSINETTSTKGSISKISNNQETLRLTVDQFAYSTPGNLVISPDERTLYLTFDGKVYTLDAMAASPTLSVFIDQRFYGLAVDPFTGNVIGCRAPNFSSAGTIHIFSSTGTFVDEHTVGIGPNSCVFK